MEVLAILIGAGVIVASPFIPVLRPAAKVAVEGGLVVAGAVTKSATYATEHWKELIAEAEAELIAEAEAKDAKVATIAIPIVPK